MPIVSGPSHPSMVGAFQTGGGIQVPSTNSTERMIELFRLRVYSPSNELALLPHDSFIRSVIR